jgi:hypothetical protein
LVGGYGDDRWVFYHDDILRWLCKGGVSGLVDEIFHIALVRIHFFKMTIFGRGYVVEFSVDCSFLCFLSG